LLDGFDRQRQIDAAARLVARFLTLGHPPETLIATLAQALLREDAGFHAYQMLEAGVRQFHEWGNCDQGRHILIAVVRYSQTASPREAAEPSRPQKRPATAQSRTRSDLLYAPPGGKPGDRAKRRERLGHRHRATPLAVAGHKDDVVPPRRDPNDRANIGHAPIGRPR
jgi:hypothetical protein